MESRDEEEGAGPGVKQAGRLERWKAAARTIKTQTYALALAYRDPRLPWRARLVAGLVVMYAFSPIDLIPDFVPVLGYLDDLVLIPLGVTLALRLIPAPIMDECRARAAVEIDAGRGFSRAGMALVIFLWLLLAAAGMLLLRRFWPGS